MCNFIITEYTNGFQRQPRGRTRAQERRPPTGSCTQSKMPNMEKNRRVLVYLGATIPNDSAYTDAVKELGQEIVRRGMSLVFGGSREGTMTILADTVLNAGGHVVGVFPEELPRSFLYEGLPEVVMTRTFAERKATMLALADMVVAMPGSFGTWDELFDALESQKVNIINNLPPKPIGVLNVNGFYDGVMQLLRRSIDDGYTTPEYERLLRVAPTVKELMDMLA